MTPGEQPIALEELLELGPIRAAANAAIAGRLLVDLSVCRDRAGALAPRILDAAIAAARARGRAQMLELGDDDPIA